MSDQQPPTLYDPSRGPLNHVEWPQHPAAILNANRTLIAMGVQDKARADRIWRYCQGSLSMLYSLQAVLDWRGEVHVP